MEYSVHIYEAANPADVHIEHFAERNSIALSYLGSDSKTQPIITSELKFTLEVLDGEDGKYLQYFTPDEKKWVVEKRIHATQEVIWKGFLLPETYSEPYTFPTFYPAFAAVDGLGLLRGKTLAPDFYKEEKNVVEVIIACLQLTGVDFDLYYAPAIKNSLKEYWHEIILDARHFKQGQKIDSAYQILEDLVESLQCQLFQSEGRWYLEGINKRQLPKVQFYKYSIADGSYLGTFEISKNIKVLDAFLGEANIQMVPALGKVTVSHSAAEVKLDEDLIKETKTPWILPPGISGKFNARYWDFTFYEGLIAPPDHYLELIGAANFDPEKFIALKNKPFILKGTKIKMKLAVEFARKMNEAGIRDLYESGQFVDCFIYKVSLGNTVLFYNETTTAGNPSRLALDIAGKGEIELNFIAQEDGLLNIELFQPRAKWATQHNAENFRVTKLDLEDISQQEDFIYTEIIDASSSVTSEIDLAFSEDVSAVSKCFYLEKIRAFDPAPGVEYQVPILYGRQINGKNYSIVNLAGAVLIETYSSQVHWQQKAFPVKDPVVHYNLFGGNEIAIETKDYYSTDAFWVKVAKYSAPTISRIKWLEWSDAIFGIEKKPFPQVVAEIRKKLFFKPHLMVNGSVAFPVKINDLLKFKYRGESKYLVPTSVDWMPDDNESSFTLIEGIYAGESQGNIPPFVEAGPDIILEAGQTTAQISEAFVQDNDGFIANTIWEIIAGDPGATFSNKNALNPLLSNLTGNAYTARLTATDNLGSSASDTMQIIRITGYTLELTSIHSRDYFDSKRKFDVMERKWVVKIVPDSPGNNLVNAAISAFFKYDFKGQATPVTDHFIALYVNKQRVFFTGDHYGGYKNKTINFAATISFAEEDLVELEMVNAVTTPANGFPGWGGSTVEFSFDSVNFTVGSGKITNLPVIQTIQQDVKPRNT